MSLSRCLRLLSVSKTLTKLPVKISTTQFYSSIIDFSLNSTLNHQSNRFEFNGIKIETALLARQFINTLTINERVIIKEELIKAEQESQTNDPKTIECPSWNQIFVVCFQNGLPFIGFGFVDNFVMIIAGDMIESYIGMYLPISTMAAAGLGNAFSDVAGIGLAHHIDTFCTRIIGLPRLTPEQMNLPKVNWSVVISKSFCIFFGCIIGMFPLLFKKDDSDQEEASDK
ncbi:Transmembrane 65 [Brachionus plicatilis]|uniref:Transmembrane 65 n=1 Tax=Brachionus plicatilis TaxID=10195 RepID=A0A3M7Q4S2_BRAPC|nr:Transmembrane 65 [Brachionus plicatilis]